MSSARSSDAELAQAVVAGAQSVLQQHEAEVPAGWASALTPILGAWTVRDPQALGVWLAEAALDASDDQPGAALGKLHLDDLVLAFAAAHQEGPAQTELHRRAEQAASRINSRLLSSADAEDVVQQLTLKLLEQPDVLLRYRGRGKLVGWLRVVLTREALARRKKQQRNAPLVEEDLVDLPGFAASPEMRAAKKEHRALVQASLDHAMRQLVSEDRELLRAFYLSGATLDELSEGEGVHRSTISKRLRRIRERLLAQASAHLQQERSKVGESAFRFVMSQVELSIDRSLGES